MGYAISLYGFSGPFMSAELFKNDEFDTPAHNLFCVRKDLRQAELEHRAGIGSQGTLG